jgi:hypothetical protein
MKYTKITLFLIVIAFKSALKVNREFPWRTPKSTDLQDNFGTESIANFYGPKNIIVRTLAREGVIGQNTPITTILNFNKEISPSQVVSGDLLNTSYDASRIIKASLAGI